MQADWENESGKGGGGESFPKSFPCDRGGLWVGGGRWEVGCGLLAGDYESKPLLEGGQQISDILLIGINIFYTN